MRKSEISAEFSADIQKVWDVVTNNENFSWRTDLTTVEILENGQAFIEQTTEGFRTKFKITKKVTCQSYAFTIMNQRFTSSWTGQFTKTATGGTIIKFTEYIHIKNPVVEILSYFFMNLKKMQMTYVHDLRSKLGEADHDSCSKRSRE